MAASSAFRWPGPDGYRRPRRNNGHIFVSSGPVKEFIGLTWMKTLASKVCCTAPRRIARDRSELGLEPATCAIRNRRTGAFSRRAASVVQRPAAAARAADARTFDGGRLPDRFEDVMAAWVLIHSPFVGPLTWEPTARKLVDRGHIVITPTLNVAESRPPYWSHFANCVAAAVRGVPEREPLVLVAHSAAGVLVPASRAAMADRTVRGYVFVDATLPRGGASLVEVISGGRRHHHGSAPRAGGGWLAAAVGDRLAGRTLAAAHTGPRPTRTLRPGVTPRAPRALRGTSASRCWLGGCGVQLPQGFRALRRY